MRGQRSKNTSLPYVYRGSYGIDRNREPDKDSCAASSYGGGWSHQCSNKPKYLYSEDVHAPTRERLQQASPGRDPDSLDRLVGYGFCHVHNPVTIVGNMVEAKVEREAAYARLKAEQVVKETEQERRTTLTNGVADRLATLGLTLPAHKHDLYSPDDFTVSIRLSTLNILLDIANKYRQETTVYADA